MTFLPRAPAMLIPPGSTPRASSTMPASATGWASSRDRESTSGVAPIAAKDVNLPSVALGAMSGSQTVTRRVTAVTAGTYSAAITLPGITATVSPAEVTLAEGENPTFTITFTTAGAPLNAYSTESLTWTSGDNTVRSPVAVRPVPSATPPRTDDAGTHRSW